MSRRSPAAATRRFTFPRSRLLEATPCSLPLLSSRARQIRGHQSMDRREFLQSSIIATLAGKVLSDATLAHAQAPAAAPPAQPSGQAAPFPSAPPRRLIMDAYTRHLHWIRSADEIGEAA